MAEPDLGPPREPLRTRVLWPLGVCVVTALSALVPLLGSRTFYMRGDTAAQFAPTWFHLGELVRDGHWPPVMDPGSWAGGNYAGEALFGVYNPLDALVWVLVSLGGDLLVSVTAVKIAFITALALGTYLLARDHGAARWAAAVVATALPFSGFTLFWDAGSWVSGLIAFAYAPWVWWTFRRALHGTLNPFWAFLAGALAVTHGNPYGTLAVVVLGFGLLVEGVATRRWWGTARLAAVGVCVAAFLPLVYLPLMEAVDLAYRVEGPLVYNTGKLRPELGDLLGLSAPTFVPGITSVTGPSQVPVTYLAWFVVPLLPWFRYRRLVAVGGGAARGLTGLAVITTAYLLLTLAPSKLWFFRWPLRLVEYLHLGLLVVVALLLTAGLARDHWRQRALGSAALVAFTAWLTWAQDPRSSAAAYGGTLMLVVLVAVVLAWHRWGPRSELLLAGVLVGGTLGVLAGQVVVFGENAGSRPWYFPSDVGVLEARFADRAPEEAGLVLQLADLKQLQKQGPRVLRRSWEEYLAGSMYHVAGVEAVNSYTGMGLERFTDRLCMAYDGLTKKCGYERIWKPLTDGGPPLVDLMKVDTVVVQPKLAVGITQPEGWTAEPEPGGTLLVTRDEPHPWPDSRLSQVPDGAEVGTAETVGLTGERVELESTGAGGDVVFGTLGWPGYEATFDGRPAEVRRNQAGLLTVALPADASGTLELSYTAPGARIGAAGAAAGTLGAVLLGGLAWWGGRRRRRTAVDG